MFNMQHMSMNLYVSFKLQQLVPQKDLHHSQLVLPHGGQSSARFPTDSFRRAGTKRAVHVELNPDHKMSGLASYK